MSSMLFYSQSEIEILNEKFCKEYILLVPDPHRNRCGSGIHGKEAQNYKAAFLKQWGVPLWGAQCDTTGVTYEPMEQVCLYNI